MTAKEVLKRCAEAGVKLQFTQYAIRYHAPARTFHPALRGSLTMAKGELLDQFNERAAILEYDARLDRAEADRLATEEVMGGTQQ